MAKAPTQSRSWSPNHNQPRKCVGTSIRCHQFDCSALLWLMSVKQASFWVLLGSIVQAIWFMQDTVVSNLYTAQFKRKTTRNVGIGSHAVLPSNYRVHHWNSIKNLIPVIYESAYMIGVQAAERSLMAHGQSSHAISQLLPKSRPAAKMHGRFNQIPSV